LGKIVGLENPNKLDTIGTETITGDLVLILFDAWEWESEQQALYRHLLALQDKLNAYLAFIESGQLREMYPNSAGQKIRIDIITRFASPEIVGRFLDQARTVAAQLGVTITLREAAIG
jgi:hypothetical protein